MTHQVECPNCGIGVPWDASSRWRPFCSERCKMIDLGAWFNEERAIPGPDAMELPEESDRDEADISLSDDSAGRQ